MLLLSLIFSSMLIAGIIIDNDNRNLRIGIYIWGIIFIVAFPIYMGLMWLSNYLEEHPFHKYDTIKNNTLKKGFLCIVFIWFLGYLAMYPGVYATDAQYWYYEFSHPNVPISSQWSPVYAGIFYFFVESGRRIFDSVIIGFGMFTFLQMVIILYGVWRIISFIHDILGRKATLLSMIFFSAVPTHVILSVTSAQDSLFAFAFAMGLIHFITIGINPVSYFSKKRNMAELAIWLILSCIIRNNGFYTILVLFVWTIVFVNSYKGKILSILALSMITVLIYQGPIYSIFGIQKGTSTREMLSLPLQQMAFAYNYDSHISRKLRKDMQNYLSDEDWKRYEPCISDQIKGRLNTELVQENILDFVDLYVKVGMESPESYFAGTLLQTYGLWYPNKQYPDPKIWHPYINYLSFSKDIYNVGFTIPRVSLFPFYEKILGWMFGMGYTEDGYGGELFMAFSEIPILSWLCKAGTYTWILMYTCIYSFIRKRKHILLPLGYLLALFLTVFLSPVIMYRYVAPFVFSGPLIVALLFVSKEKSE